MRVITKRLKENIAALKNKGCTLHSNIKQWAALGKSRGIQGDIVCLDLGWDWDDVYAMIGKVIKHPLFQF